MDQAMASGLAKPYFAPKRIFFWIILAVVFGSGLALRVYKLDNAPLDFNPTRQLHSALMARGMYYQTLPSAPGWQRQVALKQWKAEAQIEPPFMEWLAASTYRLLGSEQLWVARAYAVLFWMIGAAGLFLLIKELAGLDGAVIALAFFLFLPFAVTASRSFQPDPLMTALIIFTWWAMLRWSRAQTLKRAFLAGLLGGLAVLVKAVAIFFVGGGAAGIVLAAIGLRKAVRSLPLWCAATVMIIPYLCYYYYGTYVAGFLLDQTSLRFFPQLWIDPAFYLRWIGKLEQTIALPWLLVGLLGVFAIQGKNQRGLIFGAWLGYLVYGFTLPHHISTHDYYQLPLVPMIAIGLGLAASVLLRNLHGPRILLNTAVIGITLIGVITSAWDARTTIKRQDYSQEVAFWQKIGNSLGRGAAVIGLLPDYGYALSYYGWQIPVIWPTQGDIDYRNLGGDQVDVKNLFSTLTHGKDFFLITLLDEYDNQPTLKKLLTTRYPVLDQGEGYLIFDLHHPLAKSP
jgi:hypothetical protein